MGIRDGRGFEYIVQALLGFIGNCSNGGGDA